MIRRRLLILLLLMPIALGGCGYGLRGAGGAAPGFTDLRLRLAQSEPDFERLMRRGLEAAGIRLHEAEEANVQGFPLLAIGPEQFSGRPASTTVQARAAQITLQLAVRFSLADGETLLIDSETLSAERTYYQDLRTIAGNREEAELLREEMRRDIASQLLRRLAAVGR